MDSIAGETVSLLKYLDNEYHRTKNDHADIVKSPDHSSAGCTERSRRIMAQKALVLEARCLRDKMFASHPRAAQEYFSQETDEILDGLPFTD